MVFALLALVLLLACQMDGGKANLTIRNNSSYTVVEFYCPLSSSDDYGPNLLSSDIKPDKSVTVTIPAGTVDSYAEANDQKYYWELGDRSVEADSTPEWELTDDNVLIDDD